MGDATHVSGFTATLAHDRIEVEDTAVAVVRFRSGALGVIQATTSVHPGYPKTIAVHGDKGSAVIEQDDVIRWDFTPETDDDQRVRERFAQRVGASGGAADPKAISHEGHRRQLADFVRAVRANTAPAVDGREGKKAVDLICAAYEANRTGRVVELRS
jgi:predicted dehydrogenase